MKIKFILFLFLGLLLTTVSCKKKVKPEDATFIKIYDDPNGNRHYYPLAISPSAADEGYILVSAYDGWRIHISKVSKDGSFEWNYDLPENYVNAVPSIIRKDNQNYLVCMDAVGLFAIVLKIDEGSNTTSEIASFPAIIYPTAAFYSGQRLSIQNYDRTSMQTGIHQLDASFSSIVQSGQLNIFTDVEERIVNHISYNGKRIPFFIQETPDQQYILVNGFYNYSFSLVFLHPDLSFAGVYNGAGFNGGLTALLPITGTQFALARFSFDNLYFNSAASLNPTTIDIAESIPAQGNSEIDAQKAVICKEITIKENTYIAFLSSTRSNQLYLALYDKAGGALQGKKYLGKNIPLRAADLIQTSDMGISILAQAKIMGSYDRISLLKLTKDQLETVVE